MSEALARLLLGGTIAASLAVSIFWRARAERAAPGPSRASEPTELKVSRVVLGGSWMVLLAVYLARPGWLAWAAVEVPAGLRWVGAAAVVAAAPLFAWTLASLGRNVTATVFTRPDHSLVTHGPYRWVRHPLYSTGLLLVAGSTLLAANALFAALALALLVFLRWRVVPREEAELEARFGAPYRAWRARTGALLPRPGAQRGTGSTSSPPASRRG